MESEVEKEKSEVVITIIQSINQWIGNQGRGAARAAKNGFLEYHAERSVKGLDYTEKCLKFQDMYVASHISPQIVRTSPSSVLASLVLERPKTRRRWAFQTVHYFTDAMINNLNMQVIQYLAYVAASKPKGSSHAPASVSHQRWWKAPLRTPLLPLSRVSQWF